MAGFLFRKLFSLFLRSPVSKEEKLVDVKEIDNKTIEKGPESNNKMEEAVEPELDIPVPSKTYELPDDFENMDPFKPRSRVMANSPTPGETPKPSEPDWENMDPFKSSNKLANSPPSSPKLRNKDVVNSVDDIDSTSTEKVEIIQNNNEGETLPSSEEISGEKGQGDDATKSLKGTPKYNIVSNCFNIII